MAERIHPLQPETPLKAPVALARAHPVVAACVALLILGGPAARAGWFGSLDEVVSEFTVNDSNKTGMQCHATVAVTSDDWALPTWETPEASATSDNVYALFDETGAVQDLDPGVPVAEEANVHTSATNDVERIPDAVGSRDATNGDKGIIAWASGDEPVGSAKTFDIYARVFEGDDGTAGSQVQVNATSNQSESRSWPDAAIVRCGESGYPSCGSATNLENGAFVVVWADYDLDVNGNDPEVEIFARAFEADGTAITSPTKINTTTIDLPTSPPPPMVLPDVAVNANGDAIAAWEHVNRITRQTSIRYCEFNLFESTPSTCDPDVGLYTTESDLDQIRPAVDITTAEDLIFAWTEWPTNDQDESETDSYFLRIDSSNTATGPYHVADFAAPSSTSTPTGDHRVVVRFLDDDEDVVLMAWTLDVNLGSNTGGDIQGRPVCFDATTGVPDSSGPSISTLNETTNGDQVRPAFDYDPVSGETNTWQVWVTWESRDVDGGSPTTTDWDIRARAWEATGDPCA